VGRIAYVKFTSVNLDYYSYLFYLLKQNNQQDKTKKPDIGHTNQNPRAIRSPLHVLPADFLIFLNFVLKIQIQYFLESECITNNLKLTSDKNSTKRKHSILWSQACTGFLYFLNLSQEIRTNPRSFFYSTSDLILAPNLNHSNQTCEKQLTGRCNFWHTHDICTLNLHNLVHMDGGPRRPNCRAHFFGLTSTAATSLIFTPFTNYGD